MLPPNGVSSNVKYANLTSSTDGTAIVAAVSGAKIRVVAVHAVAGGAVTLSLKSASTKITADKALAANGGMVLPMNEYGWCETVAGEALNIGLGGAVSVGIDVCYVLVY